MTTYGRRSWPDGHVSVSPMPTPDELRKFYAEAYYQQQASATYQSSYSDDEIAHKRLRADTLIGALEQQLGHTPGSLLDIGTGEGFLIAVATERGVDALGLEYSPYAVERFNPEIRGRLMVGEIDALIEELRSNDRRFDVCVLQNVLEHVIDPVETLGRIRPLIAPGGLLAASVPNDFSSLQGLIRDREPATPEYWWAPPQHLHYFNTRNVREFLASAGFRTVDAYSDFPVELYLLHPGSNYAVDRQRGKAAHLARVALDLHVARAGAREYLDWSRALFNTGIGRDMTLIAVPDEPHVPG